MTKRKQLKNIIHDLELKLELGYSLYPWEIDDLLYGFSEKIINIVHKAIDEESDFDFTDAWDELNLIRDSQL